MSHFLRNSALVLLLLFICGAGQSAPKKDQKKAKATPVFVKTAQKAEIFDVLTYPARLGAKINATVLAESDGVVTRILAPLGTSVKRGRTVLQIKHTDPIYDYAAVSVTAPVSGVVSAVEVTVGSRVTKGKRLAAITNPKKIRIDIEVAATDLSDIQKGLEGELLVSGQNNRLPVKVVGISPFVDPATGTASAELQVQGKHANYPGQIGRVSFRVRKRNGIRVPQDAVIYRKSNPFLRIVEKGKAKLVKVELGPRSRGEIEIREGLSNGAQFIVRANKYISDGDAVIVEQSEKSKIKSEAKPQAVGE